MASLRPFVGQGQEAADIRTEVMATTTFRHPVAEQHTAPRQTQLLLVGALPLIPPDALVQDQIRRPAHHSNNSGQITEQNHNSKLPLPEESRYSSFEIVA